MGDLEERVVETAPADMFDSSRLYGKEKYKLQNMLIRQVDYPAKGRAKEFGEFWSDRCFQACDAARRKVVEASECKAGGGDACGWFRSCSPEEFLAYAQACLDNGAWSGKPCDDAPKVTGARMVRYTNVSSGYPTYRWDLYFGKAVVKSTAPVNLPEPRGMPEFGRYRYGDHFNEVCDYYGW